MDSGRNFFWSHPSCQMEPLDLLGTPSSMWKAKEKVETVLGSTLEQCCEPIYCDLACVSKTLGMSRYVYKYVMYVSHVFLADEF